MDAKKYPALASLHDTLTKERDAILEKSKPFRDQRAALLARLQPIEDELRTVNAKIKEVERGRLVEIENQLALLNAKPGKSLKAEGAGLDAAAGSAALGVSGAEIPDTIVVG